MYERLLRKLLFRMDPERAHNTALWFIAHGLVRGKLLEDPRLEQTLFGVKFPNPLGLAAGFDKNAVALSHWHKLGFGFVEVGTITYHPQLGNPKPRMFRLPADRALINRLGFNNRGAKAAATQIEAARPQVPFGINLGKSKVTPLGDAASDYERSYGLLHELGSYFVLNVSSPNTPGLRSLQEKGALLEILAQLKQVDASRQLFVKIAPDLETSAIDEVIEVAHEQKLAGLIATNTTISRDGIPEQRREQARALQGGLSGAPLKARSDEVLRYLHGACDKNMILIGVGGIFTGSDLYGKITAGAHLAQLYTGFVYGGPNSCWNVLSEFLELLGGRSLHELRGSAVASGC